MKNVEKIKLKDVDIKHINVNTIHNIHTVISGIPPIAKCDTAPVNAVNAIINTLVPTAVLSSYPSTEVRISNIIIPPPAPMKPHIKPINTKKKCHKYGEVTHCC